MSKTTRDEIDIDLNGSIDSAIRKLQKLKKQYPSGRIELGSHTEYGETYEHLRLSFTRDKTPLELEYDDWKAKLDLLSHLRSSARTFTAEGMDYPREGEIVALEEELGAWGKSSFSMGWLQIFSGEIVFADMMRGGYRRDGSWVYRCLGAERFDELAQGGVTEGRDGEADSVSEASSTRSGEA